jgi:peptidoglycan hydrolase CwlO-like protein
VTEEITGMGLKELVFVITLLCSTAGAGISFSWWFNRQLSQAKRELYSHVGKHTEVIHNNRERIGLMELSNRHQESRLDLLDDKIDGIQNDITETKADISRLNQKLSENHLMVLGAIQQLGDKIEFQKALAAK